MFLVNGLNPGVSVVRIVWSSGWGKLWKELLLVTDVSTTWAEVIFRVTLDSEDDFRSGCRNVTHQQHFFSELPSPGRSHNTNYKYSCSTAISTLEGIANKGRCLWVMFVTTVCFVVVVHKQVKISDIISRRFGDFMTPLSRVEMRPKLTMRVQELQLIFIVEVVTQIL